ncbi:UNKNOWN [Stylonychia lemnae]|uniref:TLDc domain-containing protein n=1 Tax=Stylonychia lemnae TaxID=5949 RepID=A0A078A2A4_STYLE|nr:UNKNOWN [Stylonychia lemnae]|eukprot:CDW75952.1 UNKNOWN [Stylonychia lemnae]
MKEWIGYDCSLKLLYRASKSGKNSQKFHFMCDNKGVTLTVFKVGSNFVFGGFTNVKQHTPNGKYPTFEKDPDAFLFQLFPHKTKHPLIKNPDKAVARSDYHLACFGKTEREPQEAADLEVWDSPSGAGRGICNLGNNYYLPESLTYGSVDAKKYLAGQASFVINDMEVFQVKKKTTTAKISE